MRTHLPILVVAGAILVPVAAPAATQQPLERSAPEAAGMSSPALAAATTVLQNYVQENRIAGAVAAVARHGRLVYLEPVGFQNLETRAPMNERSLFRIYSMTKAVTAVAVMMLHEEGKFRLDDPVSRYLPAFDRVAVAVSDGVTRPPARPITIEDLLLHTSGLNHRTSAIYRREAVRSRAQPMSAFLDNIVRVPLMEDPGTRYRYSEATTVLGALVEVWSGQPLDQFMAERIFRPLGMNDTGFWVPPEQRERLTTVYGPGENGRLIPIELEEELPFTEPPVLLEGAVGLVSTAPDFLRFSQMLLDGGELGGVRLLNSETVARMTRNGLSDEVQQARGGPMGWGLANVNVVLDPTRVNYPATVGEYGWDGSAGTIFWVDPVNELAIVLLTQSSPANPGGLRQQFRAAVQGALVP